MMNNLDYDVIGKILDKFTLISEIMEKLLAEQQKQILLLRISANK